MFNVGSITRIQAINQELFVWVTSGHLRLLSLTFVSSHRTPFFYANSILAYTELKLSFSGLFKLCKQGILLHVSTNIRRDRIVLDSSKRYLIHDGRESQPRY